MEDHGQQSALHRGTYTPPTSSAECWATLAPLRLSVTRNYLKRPLRASCMRVSSATERNETSPIATCRSLGGEGVTSMDTQLLGVPERVMEFELELGFEFEFEFDFEFEFEFEFEFIDNTNNNK